MKFLKKKSRFFNFYMPLSLRLTIYFTVFGIFIGYLSFVIMTMISTRSYIQHAAKSVLVKLDELAHNTSGGDSLLVLMKNKKKSAVYLLNFLRDMSIETHAIQDIRLYYYTPEKDRWKIFITDGKGNYHTVDIQEQEKALLEKGKNSFITYSEDLFFGKGDTLFITINITRPVDKNKYLLRIMVNRKGIVDTLKKHVFQFAGFGLFLVFFSLLLGIFFSRHISRPVEKLSRQASEFSEGKLDLHFTAPHNDEIGSLAGSLEKMARSIQAYIQDIERNLELVSTMNRVDKAVLSSISRNDLLDNVMGIVSSLFPGSSILLMVENRDKKGFEVLSHFNSGTGLLNRPFIAYEEMGKAFAEKAPVLFQITGNHEKEVPSIIVRSVDHEIGSFINCPVLIADEYLGSVILTKEEREGFSKEEINSIQMLSDQIGIALESVKTFEIKENLLLGILMALTRSIDAKSRWTAGHSERVAHYAEKLAIDLGLEEDRIRKITISAILHDIGKIAVPETILDKPARLTEEEYGIIKKHPEAGADIISEIPLYGEILPGILYHHEHWDGTGYPFALKGEEIPLGSRIITIADVYDAVTAERPYRKGMDSAAAMTFLEENKGLLFDPDLTDKFLAILREEKSSS